MFWFYLSIVLFIAFVVIQLIFCVPWYLNKNVPLKDAEGKVQRNGWNEVIYTKKPVNALGTSWTFFGFSMFIFFVVCGVSTIAIYTDTFDLRKQEAMLPQKLEQKQKLVKLVDEQLSADKLAALVDATTMESVLVILGNPSGPAAAVLIERANQIVLLNVEINELKNSITSKSIDICNAKDNMFVPRIPFVDINCKYDFPEGI